MSRGFIKEGDQEEIPMVPPRAYLPEGVPPENCRNEVMDRLARMAEAADGSGIALCHENEKGIYGDLAVRCADLLDSVPSLRCVFDPANFIQCGQDIQEAWKKIVETGAPQDDAPKQGADFNWQCWTHDPDGNKIELMQISKDSPQMKFIESCKG